MAADSCPSCGVDLLVDAKFCHACGTPIRGQDSLSEYKQVTVLFADVVHSMAIASAVDAERLREIMTELFTRSAVVVQRYGGTVDKFTGDGIMALFGAPIALEDHAVRACRAALDIQDEAKDLAHEIECKDGVALAIRVGLNSGRVIAGEIASGAAGYTAIGEQVGLAQRMESVAPPGGVMLSASTARLVDQAASLADPEMVQVKGATSPVHARRLIDMARPLHAPRWETTLVGRTWELGSLRGILEQAVSGQGGVVSVIGSPGIGKSRMVREVTAIARSGGVEVSSAFCESHTTGVAFGAAAKLLRSVVGLSDFDDDTAQDQIRKRFPGAEPDELLLVTDLLGLSTDSTALNDISPDARRRRLTRLFQSTSLSRESPALFVVEDVHWIDEASESMLADLIEVIPRTRSMVLMTWRPEYAGALARMPNSQRIMLGSLSDAQSAALTEELLGTDPSVADLERLISAQAGGNPFFAQEIVRDLVERHVLYGEPGAYVSSHHVDDIEIPDTLHAAIASRIDRLEAAPKLMLNAAAVVGNRFAAEDLTDIVGDTSLDDLVQAQLIDPVMVTPRAEYAFHHPLIRAVAYESQLKSQRAQLHRRVAAAIEERAPESADANAALIADHLQTAGDLQRAYDWHMRAGGWLIYRDINAARNSWQRARQVADLLPEDDPARLPMRIAPRTLLSGSTWRVGGDVSDTGFDELHDLSAAAGDKVSLAIGMCGLLPVLMFTDRHDELPRLTTEYVELVESIDDPVLTVALLFAAITAKMELTHEAPEGLRLAQRMIELADGDPTMGNLLMGSPLAFALSERGVYRTYLGHPGWRADFDEAIATARPVDANTYVLVAFLKYAQIGHQVLTADAEAMRGSAELLEVAERIGDEFMLGIARLSRGIVLVRRDGPERQAGYDLLRQARESAEHGRYFLSGVDMADLEIANLKMHDGDADGAIDLTQRVCDKLFDRGTLIWAAEASTGLVEALLKRGTAGDVERAREAIERLARATEGNMLTFHELSLLRTHARMARAKGDEPTYRDYVDRYRARAIELGFDGHIAIAETMLAAV